MELLQLATLLIKQVGVLSHAKRLYWGAAVRSYSASLKHTCVPPLLMHLPPSRCCRR